MISRILSLMLTSPRPVQMQLQCLINYHNSIYHLCSGQSPRSGSYQPPIANEEGGLQRFIIPPKAPPALGVKSGGGHVRVSAPPTTGRPANGGLRHLGTEGNSNLLLLFVFRYIKLFHYNPRLEIENWQNGLPQ